MPIVLLPAPYRTNFHRDAAERSGSGIGSGLLAKCLMASALLFFLAAVPAAAEPSGDDGGVVTIAVDDSVAPQDAAPAQNEAADADEAGPADGDAAAEKADGEEDAKADEQSAPEPVAAETAASEPAADSMEPELPQIPSNGSFGQTIAIDGARLSRPGAGFEAGLRFSAPLPL